MAPNASVLAWGQSPLDHAAKKNEASLLRLVLDGAPFLFFCSGCLAQLDA